MQTHIFELLIFQFRFNTDFRILPIMNKLVLILLLLAYNVGVSQSFSEIESNQTTYKFPYFEYESDSIIENKINSFLQLKHLSHLPGEYKDHPFSKALARKTKIEYYDWEYFELNSKIVYVRIYGKANDKDFGDIELFDIRTGDFFDYHDLFKDNNNRGYEDVLTKKIDTLIADEKMPAAKTISILIELKEKGFLITISKLKEEAIEIPYELLSENLSDYGKNLLLDTSDDIVRRPDVFNKIFRDNVTIDKGGKYERQLKFRMVVLKRGPNSTPSIYNWREKRKALETYTESIVTEDSIEGNNYLWDSLANEKVKTMHTLNLEKLKDNTWEGTFQMGSPVYPVLFKEF